MKACNLRWTFALLKLAIFLLCSKVNGKALTGQDFCEEVSNEGKICKTDGELGLCYSKRCSRLLQTHQEIIIKVRYPPSNKFAKKAEVDASKMFLRGSGLGLSWSKGKPMKRSNDKDTWELSLSFRLPSWSTEVNKKPASRFEFRVYLEDSRDMLGANFVLPLPMSTNTVNATKVPEFWTYPWFFKKEGTVNVQRIYSPQLGYNLDVTVYLPASFEENIYKRYETLIVHDGQRLKYMVPDLDILMVKRALIKEVLVIGVHNGRNRTQLLAPTDGTETKCKNSSVNLRTCDGCLYCNRTTRCTYEQLLRDYQRCYKWVKIPKVYGEVYLDFIEHTIIPQCISSYRALAGAENVGIMGFSFGGLISCHAIWTRPQTFGSAACMSPSLWWPLPENGMFPDDAVYRFTTTTLWKHRGARPRQKIYIDVGGAEGKLMVEPARNATAILARSPYFEINENLWFYIWQGEDHNFLKSIRRMWVPMIAIYDTSSSPEGGSHILETEEQTSTAGRQELQLMLFFWIGLFPLLALLVL